MHNLDNAAIINDSDYFDCIDLFWDKIMCDLEDGQRVMVKFMIELEDSSARTLSKLEFITNESRSAFKKLIHFNINNIYEHYITDDLMIKAFVIRYKILKPGTKTATTIERNLKLVEKDRTHRSVHIPSHPKDIPLSTNPVDFGKIIRQEGNII